ncbi:FG-GAP repeat domain-containing protein [Roseovarius salinarum]|uniref:FG-GAP repeat domain-containing protein n=1 Tax=Roseovarius salinarum TaxID=1981892 RepID=UPI000C341146|nr:VCBS repeat-containing protein [Roseovarius salinarum]
MARARWRTACCAALLAVTAGVAAAQEIATARYEAPTTRYDHGVLGDAIEWGALVVALRDGREVRLTLPEARVFEDTAPRLADLDGDGAAEVIVVESHRNRGARLAVYGAQGLLAATPYIGRPHRWLAPVGAADLDGDGRTEIAYVDRPHLAKRLRVWRFEGGKLRHLADLRGVTNHRIGWDHIPGGIRDCGGGPEMILASGDWARVVAVTLRGGAFDTRALGPYDGAGSLDAALACS